MPVQTLTQVPSRIVAGNTTIISLSVADCPATLWTGIFTISRAGSALKNITAVTNGLDFLITIASADTFSMTPGPAEWFLSVTETATSQRTTARSGTFTLAPYPSSILPETPAQTALAVARAALSRATAAPQMFGANQMQNVQHMLSRLREEVTRCQAEVWKEQREMGLGAPGGTAAIGGAF